MICLFQENIWKLVFYNNINACILFLPLMYLAGEVPVLLDFDYNSSFWLLLNLSGILGFSMGLVTGVQIKVVQKSYL